MNLIAFFTDMFFLINPFNFWVGVVFLSFLIGAVKGIEAFSEWTKRAEFINCPIKSVEPIVNISYNVGVFMWYITQSGLMSAFVGGTCPISVPILIMFSSQKTTQKKRYHNE